jgi:hypothetical protein
LKLSIDSVIGTPDDEIMTTTFVVDEDDATDNDFPIMITFSMSPGQHDPEAIVEALRAVADSLDEAIDDALDAIDAPADLSEQPEEDFI